MGKSLGNVGFGCTDRTIANSGPGGMGGSSSQPATLYDSKGIGVDAGSFTSGSWITRNLNTVQSDPESILTLAVNQILLAAGSYVFFVSCPAFAVGNHQARLYNVTGSSVIAEGTVETTSGMSIQTRSIIRCSVTVVVPTIVEIQHRCTITRATDGLGMAGGISNEIYTVAQVWSV